MAYGYTHDEHVAKLSGCQDADNLAALQKAVYLLLDATEKNPDKITADLSYLAGNYGLSSDITYDNIKTPNGEHQWYTHLGWNHDYSKELPLGWTQQMADNQQRIFLLRKSILLNTVKRVYPSLAAGGQSNEKIDSLAALLYYTHIAGDLRFNERPDNLISIPELVDGFAKHLHALFGAKANPLIDTIRDNLKDVTFEENADPMDKTFAALFETVPGLLRGLT
ncbi:MAG: hypothetical protein FWG66_03355 [Spirochaetes bacterium]|nr:hypothetical protein [Spirochaetota bacterium]